MRMPIQDKEEATFQMAPMIDMVFLLLVFFMCASHMAQQQNLPMEIPEASKAVVPKERPDRWIVNVDLVGNLYEGMNPVPGNDVELLAANVKARLQVNPKMKIYLRADRNSPHKNVKKVIQEMAKIGVDDFIFGVYIPPESRTVTTNPAP
jgi:biopolymer transport protein ExbD